MGDQALVAAAVIAAITAVYLVRRRRDAVPRFSFSMSTTQRNVAPGEPPTARTLFSGTVRNHGTESTSLEHIYLVVWRNGRRTATRRFGGNPRLITGENGQAIAEPIPFNGRESKRLNIDWDVPYGPGTVDHGMAMEVALTHDWAYDYQLAFEDVNGHLFDQAGRLASRKTQKLWWKLPDALTKLAEGHPLPFVRQQVHVYGSEVAFLIRRGFWALGL